MALAIAAIYFLAAKLGLRLAFVNASASPVWPPTGIAIAALLLLGHRVWPGILLGAFLANLTTAGNLATSAGIAVGNTLEGLSAAFLVRRFAAGARCFERPADIFRFVGLAGAFSTSLSATMGVASLALGGFVAWGSFGDTWVTWWLGDFAGAMLVVPLVVSWWQRPRLEWRGLRAIEALALLAGTVVIGFSVFAGLIKVPAIGYLPNIFSAPVLLWAAYRFGAREVTSVLALLAGMAIFYTLRGSGPFARYDANAALLLIQSFVAVWSVTVLALSAAATERRRVIALTQRHNRDLERRVAERTGRLRESNEALRREIEERVRTEENLRASEVRLREAQDVAGIGSWEWDVATNRLWWSETLRSIYGVEPEGFGASYGAFLERVHPEDRDRVDGVVQAACRDGQAFRFDHRIVRPDGEVRTLNARGHVLTDADGRVTRLIGTGVDITERQRQEEERERWIRGQAAKTEAEQANQLKDQFLAVLSHELRNPLNAIVLYARVLREQQLDAAGRARAIAAIERNAHVQNRLVMDLLDLSRLNSGRMELQRRAVDPAQVIEEAIETMRPAAEAKAVLLRRTVEGGGRRVFGDPERLQQVVWNLLSNAIHFTPEGGEVEVRLTSNNGTVAIHVEDQGPGFHPDLLPVAFDAAQRDAVSRPGRGGGLGLGLALVRRLTELHGGTATAANRANAPGAAITVMLPSLSAALALEDGTPAEARPCGPVPLAATARPLRGVRVLVIEDDLDSAHALAALLAGEGAAVSIAESCAHAAALFAAEPPQVLVSDIALPDGDGYDLLPRLRALPGIDAAAVPAIALTACAGAEHARRALECGYQRHIAKPFETAELVEAISEMARGAAAAK
jgi:PAS domain S-box-containing protein